MEVMRDGSSCCSLLLDNMRALVKTGRVGLNCTEVEAKTEEQLYRWLGSSIFSLGNKFLQVSAAWIVVVGSSMLASSTIFLCSFIGFMVLEKLKKNEVAKEHEL